jgi:two-component system LytT family response regulator
MPEISGFDVIEAIGLEHMRAVIFVTALDQFAVRAFDVHAVDYMFKPIDNEQLLCALDRARRHLQESCGDLKERIAAVLEDLGLSESRRWAKRLTVKLSGRVLLVDVNAIDRMEACGNNVEHCIGSQVHLLRETLTNLTSHLDPACFARISRSSTINIERIRELQPMFNGDFVVILRDGTEVAGSRRYRGELDRLPS